MIALLRSSGFLAAQGNEHKRTTAKLQEASRSALDRGDLRSDRKMMKNGTFDSMSREVLREADLGPKKLEFFDDFGYRKPGM